MQCMQNVYQLIELKLHYRPYEEGLKSQFSEAHREIEVHF